MRPVPMTPLPPKHTEPRSERRAGSHRPITESAEQRPVGTGPTAIDTEDDHRTRWTGGVAWSGKVVRYELIVMNVEIPSCSDRRIGLFQTRFEVCAREVRAEPDVASWNAVELVKKAGISETQAAAGDRRGRNRESSILRNDDFGNSGRLRPCDAGSISHTDNAFVFPSSSVRCGKFGLLEQSP